MYDYFPKNTLLNLWWKRKLRTLGYKSRQLLFIKDRYCDICHRVDQVYPVQSVYLCPRCAEGVMTKGAFAVKLPNFLGKRQCMRCGRRPPVIFRFNNINVCLKCMWYILSRKKHRMSCSGDRIV